MGTEDKADVKVDEVNDNNVKGRKCFIITPIGSSEDAIFRHINGVIQSVIRPVLKEYGFSDVRAAHEISDPGSINNQLVNRIIDDDLVIANLTGKNPNVMYELCLRHAVAKPVIHICEEGTILPFDIKGERTIFYTNDMYGCGELKRELMDTLKCIDYEAEYKDNPIYSAIKISSIIKNSDKNENGKMDTDMLIIQQMDKLAQEVSIINRRLGRKSVFEEKSQKTGKSLDLRIERPPMHNLNSFINALKTLVESLGGGNVREAQDSMWVLIEFDLVNVNDDLINKVYIEARNCGIKILNVFKS